MTIIKLSLNSFGDEAEQFAAWLRARGYDATVGHTTSTEVDDDTNVDALWEKYCDNA